ncbi:MAG TPA: tripartite tricarboxylate transporter substrate binding protein [Ramlibacter sp.]|nr:tripartite tricarboxylate transporter substrate binding protein [Ramlibacter sp.]
MFKHSRARRAWLGGFALAAGLCTGASAQNWPVRPIKFVVPAAPGGSADPIARLIAEELGKSLGQAVVVENRPGANGNIGAAGVAKSAPDGYTLLLGWPGTIVSAVTLYEARPFHPQKDFDPIVTVASAPNVVVVHPSLPIRSLAELTDYAKKHPAQLNFGSTGSGSSYHLSGELYKKTNGVFMVHIPYSSPGAVFTDLLGARLQLAFPGAAAVVPFVRDGKLRILAVMADKRSAALPNVPTAKELGQPALVSETWFGVLAPKGTPPDVIHKINESLNAVLNTAAFRDRLGTMGYTPMGGKPEAFAKLIADDIMKWGEVVKFSGAKVD